MPTLYYSPGACSLAAHIVLEWAGKPYEAIRVDLHHLPEGYREINPAGAVPALIDDGAAGAGGAAITQAAAVLTYLALTHPELDLLVAGSPREQSELTKWTSFFTGDLHPAFWPVFLPGRFTTATEEASLEQVKAAGLDQVRSKLRLLEARLAGRTWIVADKRTIVDAYATPMLNWASSMLPEWEEAYPNLAAHRARMHADPAVRRAMEAEGLAVETHHEHV